jgi:hypothetical protein
MHITHYIIFYIVEVWRYSNKTHEVHSYSKMSTHLSETATLLCCVGVSMTSMMERSRESAMILTAMSVGENISQRGMQMASPCHGVTHALGGVIEPVDRGIWTKVDEESFTHERFYCTFVPVSETVSHYSLS